MADSNHILEVRDLRVSYHTYAGEVQSVRGVSFDVETGKAIAIVGESGCGKSVTAKTIMGLIKAPQGEVKEGSKVLYKGENILDYDKAQWRAYRGDECAIIFQDALAALNPTMRVGKQIMENLIAHRHMSKAEAKTEAIEMLRRVGIPEPEKRFSEYPHQFSGGMRQRVMIAIAFACDPNLLICDEPTTALDVTIQSQILDIIKELQREHNTSVIMITHDLGVVANIAQSIVVMYSGMIVERGTCEDIFYRAPSLHVGAHRLGAAPGPQEQAGARLHSRHSARPAQPPEGLPVLHALQVLHVGLQARDAPVHRLRRRAYGGVLAAPPHGAQGRDA